MFIVGKVETQNTGTNFRLHVAIAVTPLCQRTDNPNDIHMHISMIIIIKVFAEIHNNSIIQYINYANATSRR